MYETFPDVVRVEAAYRQTHLEQEFRHAGGHRHQHHSQGAARRWLHRQPHVATV
jgi:hypothetical protein